MISLNKHFKNLSTQNKFPQVILLEGKDCFARALEIAKLLIPDLIGSYHPDLFIYHPEGKAYIHNIEAIKELQTQVFLPPYQNKKKVFIIDEVEKLNQISGNALLKTCEEPLKTSFIILTTKNKDKILKTLLSRAQIFNFHNKLQEVTPKELITDELGTILKNLDCLSYAELHKQIEQLINFKTKIEIDEKILYDSVWQKAQAEKKQEGKQALESLEKMGLLLTQIWQWYRDLHLLSVNGPLANLFFNKEFLQESLEKGMLLPLAKIENLIQAAEKSFERSNSFSSTLEKLFLQLQDALFQEI